MTTIHENHLRLTVGAPVAQARKVLIMLHGRGATAQDILSLSSQFMQTDVAYIAPQAVGNTWYPNRFTAPTASNEPYLTSALNTVEQIIGIVNSKGAPSERIVLMGFSQGACLALEVAARHPRRYAGIIGLSGALIENGDQPRVYSGSLDGTPVFLGCSDIDAHIPAERVQQSEQIFKSLGAAVTLRLYPGMDHAINDDEIEMIREFLN